MSKKLLFSLSLIFFSYFFFLPLTAYAIENPLARPNNKIGIHILFDSELSQAAQLVNANDGDWGYVTIPIQAGDRDLERWQKFMDTAKQLHVIPIIRLATEGDYFNTHVWRKPNQTDIIDFANFLNSLDWPTKNRYVIVFNEVNRGDEWGGQTKPAEYANLLSFAVTVFKSKNPDFFIISSGMDNAAPNQGTNFNNEYDYLRLMNASVPGIFRQIDGMASHSYPNPAFSQAPTITSLTGTGSFTYERMLLKQLSNKNLPVFITETGWTSNTITDEMRVSYYQLAMNTVWNDPNIVAITPFLLQGWGGPFQQFSFIGANNVLTKQYQFFHDIPKIKGAPTIPARVLAAQTQIDNPDIPVRDFSNDQVDTEKKRIIQTMQIVFNWLVGVKTTYGME